MVVVYVNGSDRVLRLIQAVNRPNFKITLDVGNFMYIDEDSPTGIKKNLIYAIMIHFKDWYLRHPYDKNPGEGIWYVTNYGNLLKGAIIGYGEIDVWQALKMIRESGYNEYILVEFDGMEDE